jgi:hypothetical protein
MRTTLAVVVALLTAKLALAAEAAQEPPDQFDPEKRVTFTAEQIAAEAAATKMPVPEGAWTPAGEDIETLEGVLAPLLVAEIARGVQGGDKVYHLRDYHRQYVGMTKDGTRFIFVNALLTQDLQTATGREGDPNMWKQQMVIRAPQFGCRSFVAVYNVEAKSFKNFSCPENIFLPAK